MKQITSFVVGGALVALLSVSVAPAVANAQATFAYQPQTQAETIAYLYGRIAMLLEIKAMLERGGSIASIEQPTIDYVAIDTHKALEITETTSVLRGEVVLYGGATARAWFEYGQDEDFLDQKTSQISVRSAYDRAVRKKVTSLEEDERYYFRIAVMDNDGIVKYGPVHAFRTDESDD